MTVEELLEVLDMAPRDAEVLLMIPEGGNYVATEDVAEVHVVPRRGDWPPVVELYSAL